MPSNSQPMESIATIIPFPAGRPRRSPASGSHGEEEAGHDASVCPTCKCPFSETAHGWLRGEYDMRSHKSVLIPCPTCSGDATRRMAARRQAELVAKLFGGSQIPFAMRTWTFSTFPQDGDQAALRQVRAFVARHLAGDEEHKRGLYLVGSPGRGKTGLAISALKAVMEAGQIGLFVPTQELMHRLRASYGKDAQETADALLSSVVTVPWLVLDDLATERPTAYVVEQMKYIIEKRSYAGLYTIFTSNLSTEDLEKQWRPEGVAEGGFHAGIRAVERLRDYCEGVAPRGRNSRQRGQVS